MAEATQPTVVNGAIIDAVSATNTKVLAEAPAMAMGSLYQTAMINAVFLNSLGWLYHHHAMITFIANVIHFYRFHWAFNLWHSDSSPNYHLKIQ